MSGTEQANVISECLELLAETRAIVVSLTFDGDAENISMANYLGASITWDIDTLKCDFPDPATERDISVYIDACHAFKLTRNALAMKKVLIERDRILIE